MPRRFLVSLFCLAALPIFSAFADDAGSDEKIVIGTDWRAEAEHGGIYQALAKGFYRQKHLDVEIRQGGPSLNQAQLLVAGRLDFSVQSNSFEPLNFVHNNIPIVVVAAAFQKDPQVLIAHPGAGNDSLAKMVGKPILISAASRDNFWQWLRSAYHFDDSQIRPYTFNLAPFLANKSAIMQGYLTSEPYAIEIATGERPVTILLADQGYKGYAAMIGTTRHMIETRPDVVRRFVEATMAGWNSYLTDDNSDANLLIKKDNPEMTDSILDHAVDGMRAYGLVRSGDAVNGGTGIMTDARWKAFFDFTVAAGIYPRDMDYKRAYSLDFLKRVPDVAP